MNGGNLVDLSTREPREHKEISSRGGKNSVKSRRRKKKEEEERESLAEILKMILYSEITLQNLKNMMESLGIKKGNNYFSALAAAVIIKAIKKGDINALCKIMELLGESSGQNNDENDSFNNLIGAIKYARKTNRKTK